MNSVPFQCALCDLRVVGVGPVLPLKFTKIHPMKKTYNGSCHCGKVRFEVAMNLDHVRVCDCTVCKKRALNHRVEEKDFKYSRRMN